MGFFLFLCIMTASRPSIEALYKIFQEHPSVTTDSRQVKEGFLFFALRGSQFDGNRFTDQALKNGASACIVDDPALEGRKGCLLVPDVLRSLQDLARHHRKQFDIPVLAITGSNGKTTTKELVTAVMRKAFKTRSTRGNLNNHIGVPLTILEWDSSAEFAVVEMGANHLGEIGLLSSIAMPTHGLITNIGKAHLEGFGSLENVRKGKTELYRWLAETGGMIFLHTGVPSLAGIDLPGGQTIRYGGPEDMIRGEVMAADPFLRVKIAAGREKAREWIIQTRLAGSYNLDNVITAFQVGFTFGVPPEAMVHAIESYVPSNSRSQLIEQNEYRFFYDAYNANPTSMMAALHDFMQFPAERRSYILGDMLELGEAAREEHLRVLEYLANNQAERVFLVGPVFKAVNPYPGFHAFRDAGELISYFRRNKPESSLIFVKGSRGIHLEKVMEYFNVT